MQKKVMVYAYTGFNLGDDLFIKILCERYPETQFMLYAPNEYKYSFETHDNISVFSSDSFFVKLFNYGMRKLRINLSARSIVAKKSDAIVQIGGSIFMQKRNWSGVQKHKKNSEGKPYFVLGANFGPYSDQQFFQEHYELFQRYTDICFRDTYSYELFKELPNVRKADDVVFQLNTKHLSVPEKRVVISVIKPSFRNELGGYDDVYYKKIKDIAIGFVEKNYNVTLISFCQKEGDQEAIEEILDRLPKDVLNHVDKYYYKFNIEEALEIIASSEYVIATRFHAMILGWVYSKPVFPISYSGKMNNVMNDIGFQGNYINLKEINEMTFNMVCKGINKNIVDTSSQIKNAEKHFGKLDEYLTT